MRLLLVVGQGAARERYLAEAARHGARCDAVLHPAEVFLTLRRRRYNGILLDVPTLVRSKASGDRILLDLAEIFPVLRVRFDPDRGCVHALRYGQMVDREGALEAFFEECKDFPPRHARAGERAEAFWPVMVRREATGETVRAVTANVSFLGCFLIHCGTWSRGEATWLRFPDIPEAGEVGAKVAWIAPWGASRGLPGVGVSFDGLSPALREALLGVGCAL